MYQNFGQLGWQHFYQQLLQVGNKGLMNHITYLYRTRKIQELIDQYEGQEKSVMKFEMLKLQPGFY